MAQAASHDDRWKASRGREARTPAQIPKQGWGDIAKRVGQQIKKDRLSMVAAGVAFYALLALFPALVALIAIYGLVFDPQQVEQQIKAVSDVMPQQAAELITSRLSDLTQTSGGALGLGVVVGIVLALWSASAGVRTLMEALNVAYDEKEKRGFLRYYGTALLLTLGAILTAVLVIGTLVALPVVIGFLGLGSALEGVITFLRWPVFALVAMFALAVAYRYGPSRDAAQWKWVTPGAVVAMVLWVVASLLFSFYVSRFGNYNEIYGSMGAVIILLLWLLISAYAVLIGAELNAEMERQTRRDTTDAPEKSMGERSAHAADTLGKSRS